MQKRLNQIKNNQRGTAVPLILAAILGLIVIGGVIYVTGQNQALDENETIQRDTTTINNEGTAGEHGGTMTESDSMMEEESEMAVSTTQIKLKEQNESGEQGTAVLNETDSKTKVTLSLTGTSSGVPQPAHTHSGSCKELGGVMYPLTAVTNGSSETVLNVSIDELFSQKPIAINVHESVENAGVFVACGDI